MNIISSHIKLARWAVIVFFFVNGFLFANWTARIPEIELFYDINKQTLNAKSNKDSKQRVSVTFTPQKEPSNTQPKHVASDITSNNDYATEAHLSSTIQFFPSRRISIGGSSRAGTVEDQEGEWVQSRYDWGPIEPKAAPDWFIHLSASNSPSSTQSLQIHSGCHRLDAGIPFCAQTTPDSGCFPRKRWQ